MSLPSPGLIYHHQKNDNNPSKNQKLGKPTMLFATMCKNEEHCIGATIGAVVDYVDYLIVCDTGSTDATRDIVIQIMKDNNLPGELWLDEWKGFDINKTLMFTRLYKKTDYILHLDADDILKGDFNFTQADVGSDLYSVELKRGTSTWKSPVIYNNKIRWKWVGSAHTMIRSPDKPNCSIKDLGDRPFYIDAEGLGSRAFDPKKYFYDAEKLSKQFFETLVNDPDGLNTRSCFYCAQSYLDYGMKREAAQWYKLYTKLEKDTWIEETFEAHKRIARCFMNFPEKTVEEVVEQMEKAMQIFPDRAEPIAELGQFLNQKGKHELAYKYLRRGIDLSLENAKKKYQLFVHPGCYGKYLYDEFSVACFWTGRGVEGYKYFMKIFDDPEFAVHRKRFEANRQYFLSKYPEILKNDSGSDEVVAEEVVKNNDGDEKIIIAATKGVEPLVVSEDKVEEEVVENVEDKRVEEKEKPKVKVLNQYNFKVLS